MNMGKLMTISLKNKNKTMSAIRLPKMIIKIHLLAKNPKWKGQDLLYAEGVLQDT